MNKLLAWLPKPFFKTDEEKAGWNFFVDHILNTPSDFPAIEAVVETALKELNVRFYKLHSSHPACVKCGKPDADYLINDKPYHLTCVRITDLV